jgi:hypothetical protein
VLCSLEKIHISLHGLSGHGDWLSLYPACSGFSQTALLDLKENIEYFENLDAEKSTPITLLSDNLKVHVCSLDCSFYNLTPLNNPGDNPTLELGSAF